MSEIIKIALLGIAGVLFAIQFFIKWKTAGELSSGFNISHQVILVKRSPFPARQRRALMER